jgi:hypothetical protein
MAQRFGELLVQIVKHPPDSKLLAASLHILAELADHKPAPGNNETWRLYLQQRSKTCLPYLIESSQILLESYMYVNATTYFLIRDNISEGQEQSILLLLSLLLAVESPTDDGFPTLKTTNHILKLFPPLCECMEMSPKKDIRHAVNKLLAKMHFELIHI